MSTLVGGWGQPPGISEGTMNHCSIQICSVCSIMVILAGKAITYFTGKSPRMKVRLYSSELSEQVKSMARVLRTKRKKKKSYVPTVYVCLIKLTFMEG